MKRIILVTDTIAPDTNGVATTVRNYEREIRGLGYDLEVISPNGLPHISCPFSKDVRLAYDLQFHSRMFEGLFAVHIATEGTLGIAARSFCLRNDLKFTTSYLTMFPEYLKSHARVPLWLTRSYLSWFHGKSSRVMCCTRSLADSLNWIKTEKGVCPKGVDIGSFRCVDRNNGADKKALYVGRVSREKNLEAFCSLVMPRRKVVVGDGPQLAEYRARFPDVEFLGRVDHDCLSEHYGTADVFVFPSKTDTYGLVMLEALACGTPVAAFPVNGAMDLADNNTVFVDEDLDVAVTSALHHADYSACRDKVVGRTWMDSATKLCSQLVFQRSF